MRVFWVGKNSTMPAAANSRLSSNDNGVFGANIMPWREALSRKIREKSRIISFYLAKFSGGL
jgi:hypothetical protein